MKRKGFFAVLAAITIAAAGFASGCGISHNDIIYYGGKQVNENIKNITYYGFKHEEKDLIAIESAIHGFMDLHPDINVNYEGIINDKSADSFYNIFDLRYSSGHLDDVFMLKQDKRMENMLYNGDLLDLKDDIDLSAYTDLVKSQITYPNYEEPEKPHVYFVPMTLTSYCLYINYDLLKSEPVNLKVPANFEEFATVCDYYVNKYASEGKNLCPIICNNNRSLRTIVQAYGTFDLYQLENSVEVIDGYNTDPLPLAENYLKRGLEFAKDMLDKKWIDPVKTKTTVQANATSGDMAEFIKGEQPFMITGSWATNRITDKIEETDGERFDYGVHPLPFLSKEKGGNVLVFDIDVCTAVNARSKNLDAAEKFISYFTNPASVWEFCNTNNSYSPLAKETRKPDNKTLTPCLDYYTNGQSVLATNYRLYAFDLNAAIDGATGKLLAGESVDSAYAKLIEGLGLGGER